MAVTKNIITEDIRRNLFSAEESIVKGAIVQCREAGNRSILEPLIAFYASNSWPELRKEVGEMLGTLKISNVEEFFMAALANPEMKHIHRDLVSFMWHSGLNPVNDIAEITKLAVTRDFEMALECLTLLENLDEVVPEEVLLESIAVVGEHANETRSKEHNVILNDYMAILQELRARAESED